MRFRLACALFLIVVLAGCTEAVLGLKDRNGPSPKIASDSIDSFADNQTRVMASFKDASGEPASDNGTIDYYNVTLTGFNFIDEQCDLYMREVFLIDKERERTKNGLVSVSSFTQVVLGASNVAPLTMAMVASAFNISGEFTDSFSKSYLFGKDSSTIFNIVKNLQTKYRKITESDKSKIVSSPIAYERIRGYLQLCMPQTIESMIVKKITDLKPAEVNQASVINTTATEDTSNTEDLSDTTHSTSSTAPNLELR